MNCKKKFIEGLLFRIVMNDDGRKRKCMHICISHC